MTESKPSKQTCLECERRLNHCIPIVRLVDQTIQLVCKFCWGRFDYRLFMNETDPTNF